jgi:hypothetical protein
MRKILLIAVVLFSVSALLQSCAPSTGLKDPNKHWRQPKAFMSTSAEQKGRAAAFHS